MLEGSRLQRGYRGHRKSRARVSEVRYNLLADGPRARPPTKLEFPEAGTAVVTGNVIARAPPAATR